MERDRTRVPPNYPSQDQYYGPPQPGPYNSGKRFSLGEEDELSPPQFKTYIAPSARTLINPPPIEKPFKIPKNPREKPFFMNAGNALFSAGIASLVVYPFIRAREVLSISPDIPNGERTRRYMSGLRQIIASHNTKTLIKGYSFYAAMIPAITLDLAIFYSLKSRYFPVQLYHELDIPWAGNISTAAFATFIRYITFHPFSDTYLRVNTYSAKLRPADFAKEILRYIKYRFQTLGFSGVYEGAVKNLPILLLFRGIQLGTCETMFQRMKYEKGRIPWIQKFICCWGITAITKYLTYPFEVAKEKTSRSEVQSGKPLKNYFDAFVNVFKQANLQTFKKATNRALRASGSALTLSIFFHVTDETPTHGFF